MANRRGDGQLHWWMLWFCALAFCTAQGFIHGGLNTALTIVILATLVTGASIVVAGWKRDVRPLLLLIANAIANELILIATWAAGVGKGVATWLRSLAP